MAYDLSSLSTALGAYHRVHSNEILRQKVFNPFNMSQEDPMWRLTPYDIFRKRFIKDEEGFARLDLDLQAQLATSAVAVQSDDAIILDGAIRKIRDVETVLNFNPYVLENTWIDHVNDAKYRFKEMPEYQDIEFVPWLTDYLLEKWMQKLRTISLWKGVYTPGATYAADGVAGQSWLGVIDGILQQIIDEITATNITQVVTTGVITSSNAYDSLETMGQAIPEHLEYEQLFLMCSRQIHDWYNNDRATTFPGDNPMLHPTFKQHTLRNRPNVTLIPTPELTGSQRVIITTKDNISWNMDERQGGVKLTYMPINVKQIQVQMIMGTGISFGRYDEIIVNDQV